MAWTTVIAKLIYATLAIPIIGIGTTSIDIVIITS